MAAPTIAKTAYPKVRRIKFPFGQPEPLELHFADGNIVFSHLMAMLSFSFPPGEEGFIRSVRRYSDQIADPVLKKRVAGFIGQEAVHGQQHDVLNDKLRELGYRSSWSEKFFGRMERLEAVVDKQPRPQALRFQLLSLALLASTAAAEHYTAALAERVLASEELQSLMGDPEVKNLLMWHAFEELEHKSVAFDVYRAVNGPEWLRILVMRTTLALSGLVTVASVAHSIFATDRVGRRQPVRIVRDLRRLLRLPEVKILAKAHKPYLKRGFHPDDIDTDELLAHWQRELFGDEGALVGHLK